MAANTPEPEFEALLRHVSNSRGFDFTAYKRSTLRRRTLLRMQALGIERFEDYIDHLEVDPEEYHRFFDAVLINVTAFFRDEPAWEYLQQQVIPQLIEAKGPSEPIRIWSAACASGEEAYTLAMLFCEAVGPEAPSRVKIFATDVDEAALSVARNATYRLKAVESVPAGLREKYLTESDGMVSVRRDVRGMVVFGRHDLLQDAPISRLDLLVCRNALMYFNTESQSRILSRFIFALREDGYLFLGKAETLLTKSPDVSPVNQKLRIFKKVGNSQTRLRLLQSVGNGAGEQSERQDASTDRIRETAFDFDPVAQIVVDSRGVLTLVNEAARRLFNIRERDVGRALQDLEVSYRPVELRSLMDYAMRENRTAIVRETNWALLDGTPRWLSTHAVPLADEAGMLGVKFVFTDVTVYKALQADLEVSHAEIETAYEEIQSTNEELETTNEELNSAVEELETTNEELQSTNEELETMNEELHSSNEELESVNQSLRERTEELDRANSYSRAILASFGLGAIVLNRSLEVQVWNSTSEDHWGARFDEVKGRHFLSLDIGLPVDALAPAIRACLAGSEPSVLRVAATNRRGRAVECEVTVRPIQSETFDPPRDGVILLVQMHEQSQATHD